MSDAEDQEKLSTYIPDDESEPELMDKMANKIGKEDENNTDADSSDHDNSDQEKNFIDDKMANKIGKEDENNTDADSSDYENSDEEVNFFDEDTPPPHLVLSFSGDTNNFLPKAWNKEDFVSAIIETARRVSNCVFITGSKGESNFTVSTLVDKALRRQMLNKNKEDIDSSVGSLNKENGPRIGVFGENECAELIFDEDDEFLEEVDFLQILIKMEKAVHETTFEQAFIGREINIPVIVVIAEGGLQAIEHACLAVEENIPVLVIKGTGKVADLIASCFEYNGDDISSHTERHLGRSFVENTEAFEKMEEFIGRLRAKKWMVTLFDIEENASIQLAEKIAKIIASSFSPMDREIRKEQKINFDYSKEAIQKMDELYLYLYYLELAKNDEIQNEGGTHLLRKVWESEIMVDLLTTLIEDNVSLIAEKDEAYMEEVRKVVEKKCCEMVGYSLDSPTNYNMVWYKEYVQPYELMVFRSVFIDEKNRTDLIWSQCENPIMTALIVSAAYSRMAEMKKKSYDKEEAESLLEKASSFENMASEVLNQFLDNEKNISDVHTELTDIVKVVGIKSCPLEFAFYTERLNFISHTCCVKFMDNVWKGNEVFHVVDEKSDNTDNTDDDSLHDSTDDSDDGDYLEKKSNNEYYLNESNVEIQSTESNGQGQDNIDEKTNNGSKEYAKTKRDLETSQTSLWYCGTDDTVISQESVRHDSPKAQDENKQMVSNSMGDIRYEKEKGAESVKSSDDKKKSKTIIKFKSFFRKLKAPRVKFVLHYIFYILAMVCYSMFCLTSVKKIDSIASVSYWQWAFTAWFLGDVLEEILAELVLDKFDKLSHKNQSERLTHGFYFRLKWWLKDNWNKLDILSFFLYVAAVLVHIFVPSSTYQIARRMYTCSLIFVFLRFLRVTLISRRLGPKVIMIGYMMKDLFRFLFILVIFVVGCGVAYHSNLYPNYVHLFAGSWETWRIWYILRFPYWQIYGENMLEQLEEERALSCSQNVTTFQIDTTSSDCSEIDWVIPLISAIYMMLSNLLLVNMIIAIFSNRFTQVQDNSEKVCNYIRISIITEYTIKLPSPINLIFRPMQLLWKLICIPSKCRSNKVDINPDQDEEKKKRKEKVKNNAAKTVNKFASRMKKNAGKK